jgi:general secretion pathway protein K
LTERRGGALLAVFWLAAGLSAIALSVATTVLGEVERSGSAAEGARSYYLARAALERALLWVEWGEQYRNPDGSPRYYAPGMRRLHFEFPGGAADVDFLPENARLNVNTIRPEELLRLLLALDVEPAQAQEISAAILDWRSPDPQGISLFDVHYSSLTPSFRARHASLEEVEEVLLVKGMTPELFHGGFWRSSDGRLAARRGLRDCLSIHSSGGHMDVNTVEPAVLAAIGFPPDAIAAIMQIRRAGGFQSEEQLRLFTAQLGPLAGRLTVGFGTMVILRSTARIRRPDGSLSDLRRTVSAQVKFRPTTKDAPYHILRWYDQGGLMTGDSP